MKEHPRVLLVDDNELLVHELQSKLRYEDFEIETAKDGAEGLQKIASFRPYVVVLDIKMDPGMDGRKMLRRLRLDDRTTRVIVLTEYHEHKLRALKEQANLFLGKPFDLEELISYLKNFADDYMQLHGGKPEPTQSSPSVLVYGILSYDSKSGRIRLGGKELLNLTPTEKKLLIFFLQNPEQLFSIEQIVEKNWGYDYANDSSNVRNVVSRLNKTLRENAKDSPYIENVRSEGYRLVK